MMGDDDGPGRKPRISNQRVLDVFEDKRDRAEPLTTSEVADIVNCHRKTAYNHLEDLVFEGQLKSKKVGSGKVYWRPYFLDSAEQ